VNFSAVNNSANKILVSAGERAVFAQNNIVRQLNSDENFDAWQSKQLVFNNTSLQEVAATLSNYYNVSIRIKKEDAAQLSGAGLTARFNDQVLSSVLDEITLITSYRIQRVSDNVYEISIK
jgi:ferric-dicitrate binding protein FerR (iron transport regulator)